MPTSNDKKIDLAFKLLHSKGFTTTEKTIDNEESASGLSLGAKNILAQDKAIPTTAPGANTTFLTFYGLSSRFKMLADISSPTGLSWYASTDDTSLTTIRNTRIPNWVNPALGNYTIRIFLTHGSSTSASAVQEIFFSDQTSPFFDYKSGILTFELNPLSIYSSLSPTPDGIQISGYVYNGLLLSDNIDNDGYIKSKTVSLGNASAVFNSNGTLNISSPDGYQSTWNFDETLPPSLNSTTWQSTWQSSNGMTVAVGTFVSATAFVSARSYADGYWHGSVIGSGSGQVTDVWGSDEDNIYATTTNDTNTIYKSTNGAISWSSLGNPGFNGGVNAIWGSSSKNVYVVGADGYISRSNDGYTFSNADLWLNFTANTLVTVGTAIYTQMSDGRIMMLPDSATEAQIFDPANDTVITTSNLVNVVSGGTIHGLSSGKVVVLGGATGFNGDGTLIQLYDPLTDIWSESAVGLSVGRYSHDSIILTTGPNAGKVLIAGGQPIGVDYGSGFATTVCEFYDPVNDSISLAGVGCGRALHKLVMLQNGDVAAIAGENGGALLSNITLYSTSSDSWSFWPDALPSGRISFGATLLSNGKVLVAGGNDNDIITPNSVNTCTVFNSDGTISSSPTLNTARRSFGIFTIYDKTLIVGGINASDTTIGTVEIFNNTSFSFTTSANNAHKENGLFMIKTEPYIGTFVTLDPHSTFIERFVPGQTTPTTDTLNDIWGSGPFDIYAVGNNGAIFHSDGYGIWSLQDGYTTRNLNKIFGSSSSNIFIGTSFSLMIHDAGNLLYSTGNGSWSKQGTAGNVNITTVWSTNNGTPKYFAAGDTSEGSPTSRIFISNGDGNWIQQYATDSNIGFIGLYGGIAGIYILRNDNTPGRLKYNPVVNITGQLLVDSNITSTESISSTAFNAKNHVSVFDSLGFISSPHYYSTGNISANITSDVGAGSGGSFSLSLTGDNVSGMISLTTGTSPQSNSIICSVVLSGKNGTAAVILQPASKPAAQTAGREVYISTNQSGFDLTSGDTALNAGQLYEWFYHVICAIGLVNDELVQ